MEDKQLDKLFKSGLERPLSYDGRDRQWTEINNTLRQVKKSTLRKYLLLCIPLVFLLGSSWFLISKYEINIQEKSQVISQELSTTKTEIETITPETTSEEGSSVFTKIENTNDDIKHELVARSENLQGNASSVNFNNEIGTSNTNILATPVLLEEECQPCEEEERAKNEKILAVDHVTYLSNAELPENQKTSLPVKIHIDLIESLGLIHLNAEHLILPRTAMGIAATPILINKKEKKFNLRIGAEKESTLSSTSALRPYIGIGFNITNRHRLNLHFNKVDIQNTVLQDWDYYNIPLAEPIDPINELDTVFISYKRMALDFHLESFLWKQGVLSLGLNTGVRINRAGESKLNYIYQSVYGFESLEKIQEAKLFMSEIYAGPFVQLDLGAFALIGNYNYNKNLKHNSYRWHNKHRYKLGINYKF